MAEVALLGYSSEHGYRMPEIVGVDMVQCGKCSEWFHVHCVHVPSEVIEESNVDWFCYLCV